MFLKKISALLKRYHQLGLLLGLDSLSHAKQKKFFERLQKYPLKLLQEQKDLLLKKSGPSSCKPLPHYESVVSLKAMAAGEAILKKGEVGCIILAGGEGTRLNFSKPKALFPITKFRKKTLLQLLCEKTAAASKKYGRPLPLVIITSPKNNALIEKYLVKQSFFGLESSQIDLIMQTTLPFTDDLGNWMLHAPGVLAEGADGNGSCFASLYNSSAWKKWEEKKIKYCQIIPIDNPLATPFEASFVGYHAYSKHDITLRGIKRINTQEKLGVICLKEGKIGIQEYSELPNDTTAFNIGNTGLICLSTKLIKTFAKSPPPLHLSHKKATILVQENGVISQKEKMIWKFEQFIFDHFIHGEKIGVLVSKREEVYAPLKNAHGQDSVQTVQEALQVQDATIYAAISGKKPPLKSFELHPQFHYPTPDLLNTWKERDLPKASYVKPFPFSEKNALKTSSKKDRPKLGE